MDMDKDMDKDKDMELVKEMDILPEFFSTFLNWLHYKRRRGESYKDKNSTLLAYKKLLKLSENNPIAAIEVVEDSMANNWAGLFKSKCTKTANNEFPDRPPKPSPYHNDWHSLTKTWHYSPIR
jgi:hypothetical protein